MTATGNSNGNGGLTGSETVVPGTGLFSGLQYGEATTLSWGQTPDPLHPGRYLNSGGSSITDTFVAPSTGTTFLLFENYSDLQPYEIVDAAQIRDISAVPEPSTYAMMIAGLAFLGFCIRRKSVPVK